MRTTRFFTRYLASALLAIALAGLSACGSDSDPPIKVSGTLTYSADQTLPKSATARVSMFEHSDDGGDKRIVAERSLHELGKKPIPFDIDVARNLIDPNGRYGLRAEVLDSEGNILWQTRYASTIKPLKRRAPVSLQLKPVLDEASLQFVKYKCDDGFHLTAAERYYRAIVKLGNRRLILTNIASGSDSRYTDEHGNAFDLSDDQLTVVIDGGTHAACKPVTTAQGGDGQAEEVKSDQKSSEKASGITVQPEQSAKDDAKPAQDESNDAGNDPDTAQKDQ